MQELVLPLTLELLSPCFMGGAHQQPELRIGSLRGLWRYWYRALYGRGDEQGHPVSGEVELFGDTDRCGRVRLVFRESVRQLEEAQWARGSRPGADYLLFSMDMNKRWYLKPGARIPLELRMAGADQDQERAARSLAAALGFGGVGARARRMGGAVHLAASKPHELVAGEPAAGPAELAERLRRLIEPAFTRDLSGQPRYHVVARGWFRSGVLQEAYPDWKAAVDRIGTSIRDFRSRRQPDYDVAKTVIQGRSRDPQQTITRAAFGLPIIFRFRSLKGQITVQLAESDRRGSPLFLTLERLQNGRVAVVWSFFGAALTPDGRTQIRNTTITLPAPGPELVHEMLSNPVWRSHFVAE